MGASRSLTWTITNATKYAWTQTQSELNHGIWVKNPPKVVPPGGHITLQSESNGLMTGCEGTVSYSSTVGDFVFYFDNPYVGDDSYTLTVPDEYDHATTQTTGNQYKIVSRCFEHPPE